MFNKNKTGVQAYNGKLYHVKNGVVLKSFMDLLFITMNTVILQMEYLIRAFQDYTKEL